jgi:soluble lytic murein transglycosylase
MTRWLLTAWVLWLGWTLAHAQDLVQQRTAFANAEQALAQGDHAQFAALAASLQDYPLYPYLLFDDLKARLAEATQQEVRQFLQRYHDTPLAWQLRRRWLTQLARQHRWQAFLKDYRPTSNTVLQCQQLQALIRTGKADRALPRVEALWLHGRSQPKQCDPVFDRWLRAGNPSQTLAWKRIDLAMRHGSVQLVRYLRRFLPSTEQRWVNYWLRLHQHPAQTASLAKPGSQHPYLQRMLVHGVRRLAWRDPVAALALWQQLEKQQHFSNAARHRVQLRLAAALLDEPAPAATAFFRHLRPGSGDAKLHELRLRAALARHDWAAYLRWQAEMPPALRDAPRWQYWRARALGRRGQPETAATIYRRLAEERSYHGFLAADRAGLPYAMAQNSAPASAERLAQLAASPALARSHELFVLDRMIDARREWLRGTRQLDRSDLVVAAKLADTWGWHAQAIFTVAQGRHWDDLALRFPLAHRQAVEQQAGRQALDPAWVYAVMRQESAFMSDARSGVGATGLMQLMPATARRVARRLPEPLRVTRKALCQPAFNITLGSAYLREVLDRLYRNRVLATAAYNAGPRKVRQWLPQQPMAADLWVELVPYTETRRYLQRVLTYTAIYQARLGLKPRRLLDQMPTIQPAESYAHTKGVSPTSS